MITIMRRAYAKKGNPYVYIAVSTNYISKPDRLTVKVGQSCSMGARRRALRAPYNGYCLETIIEQPVPLELFSKLNHIEADLIAWLHQTPANDYKSQEQITVDYHLAEMLTLHFTDMAQAIIAKYHHS